MPVIAFLLFSSCKTQRLFEGDAQEKNSSSEIFKKQEHVLRPDDKLTMSIWDHEELSVGSIFGVYNSNETYGKWVMLDAGGYVMLPKIGRLHLGGMTLTQATDTLTKVYATLVVNPVVVLKVLNREVTMLGEVKTPGALSLDKEYNNLVELLGRAGGPDYYADARIIKVIRGKDESKKEYSLDLTKLSTIEQQNIWLQSGDVVYVPPFRRKSLQKEAGILAPLAAILSSVAIFITLVK